MNQDQTTVNSPGDVQAAHPAGGPFAAGEDIRVPVREEELVVGTQPEEAGRVHLHKDVIEEQQTRDMPLNRGRLIVERVPYSDAAVKTEDAFIERDIDIPVMGEAVVVEKRVRGVEEIVIHKEVVTEQQHVSDTVRKERVTVDGIDVTDQVIAGTATTRGTDA